MNDESRVAQSKFEDARVHCCLYFIAPTGRGLKALDVAVLKKLHCLVNIIPVIGRADMLTANEQISAKAKVTRPSHTLCGAARPSRCSPAAHLGVYFGCTLPPQILADLKEHGIETMEFMDDENDVDLDDEEVVGCPTPNTRTRAGTLAARIPATVCRRAQPMCTHPCM